MENIEARKQFNENVEYVKNVINNHGKLTYYIYESLFSLAHTMYANEYVGYCEIYEFLELLQEVEVNETLEQPATQIKENIEYFKDECMRKLYEKHPLEITNSITNHITKLAEKLEGNVVITAQEYKKYVKSFERAFPMKIEEINYDYWKNLLIRTMPRCKTIKELNEVEKIKQNLINNVREVTRNDKHNK